MARHFTNASSENITVGLGGCASLSTAFTIAALVRTASDGTASRCLIQIGSGSGSSLRLVRQANNKVNLANGVATSVSTTTLLTANGWTLVVVTHAAGTTTPRFSFYNYAANTWTQENGTTTFPNTTPATSINLGSLGAGTYFDGDIAIAGAWAVAFTDVQVQSLAFSLPAWFQTSPTALWLLDQSATSMLVNDLTGNGANQSGINGTSVSTGNVPVFSYGHEIIVVADDFATVTGSGSSTVDLASTGTGVRAGVGSGSSAIALASTGAGIGVTSGSGSSSIAIASTGTGLHVAFGSGASTITLASTGSGSEVTPSPPITADCAQLLESGGLQLLESGGAQLLEELNCPPPAAHGGHRVANPRALATAQAWQEHLLRDDEDILLLV